MTVLVERAGLLTTVQDLGRRGHQHEGVPVGGAMDDVAFRLANLLVGNPPDAAALEATLDGPALRFTQAVTIAVTGADMDWRVDGQPLAPWRSIQVPAGVLVSSRMARMGCRAYVAVAGGFAVPSVLGSRGTYVPAALGGLAGRALKRGDVLPLGPRPAERANGPAATSRGIAPSARPAYGDSVRLVAGPQLTTLAPSARARLFDVPFRVSPRSDRMGVRLEATGADTLSLVTALEPLSAGVAMGTVQLPPGGEPIVLMADRQTTGGYPRLGEVATVDLPLVAQLRPGELLRFAPVSLDEAQRLYLAREQELARLAWALARPA